MPRGKGKAEEEKRVWAWEGSGWPGQGKDARLPGWAHPRSQPPAQLSGQPSSECEPNQTCLLGGGGAYCAPGTNHFTSCNPQGKDTIVFFL